MRLKKIRNEKGFSLPTVIALGVVASLWMLGTAAMVVPATGRVTAERTADMARSSCEASLDWALQELNSTATRSSIDGQTTSVPSSVLNGSNLTGTVSVSNTAAPTYSYLYSPQLDSSNAGASIVGGNGWRVLTATVSPNGGQGNTRNVRVVLQPQYKQVMVQQNQITQGPPTPLFNFAAFGGQAVGGKGNMVTNSYDSSVNPHPTTFQNQYGDIGTNGGVTATSNNVVGGSLNLFGDGTTATASGQAPTVYQGINTGTDSSVSGFGNTQINQSTSNNTPQSLPQTPTAPSNATNLGSINLSGKSTMTLTAGSYIVSSISITGNAQLNVDTSSGPVNIYVQGAGSNAGIAIGGNGISNGGLPANLRIWYSGTGDTQIAGNGSFTGVVYAPNSAVKIAGNGDLYGAVIGNQVDFNGNGTFHYDQALKKNNQLMWNPPITTVVNVATNQINYWQAVSWQEY